MPPRLSAAVAITGALLLTSCTVPSGEAPAAAPTTVTATATATVTESAPQDEVEATPQPTQLPPGARLSPDQAYAAMTAYVDHSGDAAAWFARLQPYLSPQAQDRFRYTDPVNIAATQLVDAPALIDGTEFLQWIDQNTNAGTYHLLLSRDPDGGWQVEAITPPAEGPTT